LANFRLDSIQQLLLAERHIRNRLPQ